MRVRRYVGRFSLPFPAIRPHFFGACPKKRCRAAKEKRFFYPGGSTIRVSAPASVVVTHLRPTWGRGLVDIWAVTFAGGERDWLWPLCAVGLPHGCHCRYQLTPTTQARFFGAPPRFFAQEQRNGVELAVGATIQRPRKRRTRTNPQITTSPRPKSGEERPVHRLVALTRMVEPPR